MSEKGKYKLAMAIQKRIQAMGGNNVAVSSELGTIVDGKKLKVDSLPEEIMDPDDYLICSTVISQTGLSKGDRVLVIWTQDADPVIVDKIIEGDEI